MEELILPAGYPMSLVRLRALAQLTAMSERRTAVRTLWPRLALALQTGAFLMSVTLRVSGALSSWPTSALLVAQVGLLLGSGLAAGIIIGRRRSLQGELASQLAGIQDRTICPLRVLNARFEKPLVRQSEPGVEARAEAALRESFQRAARETRVKRSPHDSLTR